MRQAQRNWLDPGKNERAQSLPLHHFYKGLKGKKNLGQMACKTSVYKFDLRAFQREPNVSAVSLGSLVPENMRQV